MHCLHYHILHTVHIKITACWHIFTGTKWLSQQVNHKTG